MFSRSYSSFLKELSVWYFLPPSDAEDALQTADVKCLVTTRQPSPRSGVSAAAGPRLLIRQVQYLLSSQLTFISEGSSPIRRLGTRLVACSSAPTVSGIRVRILARSDLRSSFDNAATVCVPRIYEASYVPDDV